MFGPPEHIILQPRRGVCGSIGGIVSARNSDVYICAEL